MTPQSIHDRLTQAAEMTEYIASTVTDQRASILAAVAATCRGIAEQAPQGPEEPWWVHGYPYERTTQVWWRYIERYGPGPLITVFETAYASGFRDWAAVLAVVQRHAARVAAQEAAARAALAPDAAAGDADPALEEDC